MENPLPTITLCDLINEYLWKQLEACCTEESMLNVVADFRAERQVVVLEAVESIVSEGQVVNHEVIVPASLMNSSREGNSAERCYGPVSFPVTTLNE